MFQYVLFTFSKYDVYNMHWADQVDFSKVVVAAAPYGGPIGENLIGLLIITEMPVLVL